MAPALRIDFHGPQRTVRAAAVILGGAGDAGADDDPALLPARFLVGALLPDRVLLELVQNLRRADRNTVCVSRHGLPAGLERVAPPELDRVERQGRGRFSSINTSSNALLISSRTSSGGV
jgi:hypothetical protein